MSVAFVPDWLRGKAQVNQETIQRVSANAKRRGFLMVNGRAAGAGSFLEWSLPQLRLRRALTVRDRSPQMRRARAVWRWAVGPRAGYLTSRCPVALIVSLIFQLLEENDQLIRCIVEYQNKGRANECVQ